MDLRTSLNSVTYNLGNGVLQLGCGSQCGILSGCELVGWREEENDNVSKCADDVLFHGPNDIDDVNANQNNHKSLSRHYPTTDGSRLVSYDLAIAWRKEGITEGLIRLTLLTSYFCIIREMMGRSV